MSRPPSAGPAMNDAGPRGAQQRVRLQVLVTADQPGEERRVGGLVEHAAGAEDQRDRVQQPHRHEPGQVRDGQDGDRCRLDEVRDDEEALLAPLVVDPRADDEREQVGRPDRRGQHADLGRAGVQRRDGDQRQGQLGDPVAELRDGLSGPVGREPAVAPEGTVCVSLRPVTTPVLRGPPDRPRGGCSAAPAPSGPRPGALSDGSSLRSTYGASSCSMASSTWSSSAGVTTIRVLARPASAATRLQTGLVVGAQRPTMSPSTVYMTCSSAPGRLERVVLGLAREPEPARHGLPPPLTAVVTSSLRVGRVTDQAVVGEVAQVPAGDRRARADRLGQAGRGATGRPTGAGSGWPAAPGGPGRACRARELDVAVRIGHDRPLRDFYR